MDLQLVRTFLGIISAGSFQEAADRVYVTQSAVSLRVKRLEDELGRKLFTRSKAGIELTPAGEQFERFARSLLKVWESGCGKTTLAKMLLGLLPPTSGTLELDGTPIDTMDRLKVAQTVQPIFQDPYSSLNPRKSIGSIITLPLKVQGDKDPGTWRKRVDEIMELVGLPRRVYNNYPSQLSGGQRQRVAIARALINRPRIVICDEPTSALDVSVQSQILNLLQDLREELGLTYLVISHNLAVVEHMATRLAVMYLGRIVEEGDADALFGAPRHPYSKALLESVLTPDPSLGVPDTHLGAAYPNPLDMPTGCRFHPRCISAMTHCSSLAPRKIPAGDGHVECHLYDENEGKLAS